MLAGTPILVMTSHDGERAGIRRDADGFLWISHWRDASPNRVAGTRLEGAEPAQIRGPDRSAVGGVLPPGARSVVVRGVDGAWHTAEVAHRAWVAFAPHDADAPGLPPVRFCDERGELVSRATPTALSSARRLDPDQAQLLARGPSGLGGACPACGASDWRVVGSGSAPSAGRIFCGACGHNDGAVYGFWSPAA